MNDKKKDNYLLFNFTNYSYSCHVMVKTNVLLETCNFCFKISIGRAS